MLAIAWPWDNSFPATPTELARRLSSSLCAGIGGHAGLAELDGIHFAYRSLHWSAPAARAWHPARLSNAKIVVFHGYFDNPSAIASELGVDAADRASPYGLGF